MFTDDEKEVMRKYDYGNKSTLATYLKADCLCSSDRYFLRTAKSILNKLKQMPDADFENSI